MRRIESSDKFFDLLDQIGRGKFITIGYVSGANLAVPTVSRKNPATNRMKKYDDYSVFGEDIGALVKITSYNMQYNHRDTVNKKYGEYKKAFNDLRAEYGIAPMQDKESYKTGSNWGSNGPDLYNGGNDALKSHSYNAQNTYGAKIKSVTYAVGTDGHIIQELTPEQVKPYLKAKAPVSGVKALRDMGVEEERIQEFIKREAELHMRYKNFESNSILWIAATINGEKIIYINDRLTRAVNDINIAPEDFISIAKFFRTDLNGKIIISNCLYYLIKFLYSFRNKCSDKCSCYTKEYNTSSSANKEEISKLGNFFCHISLRNFEIDHPSI